MPNERTDHRFEPNLLIGPELLACQQAVERLLEQLRFPKLLVVAPARTGPYNPEPIEVLVLKTSQTEGERLVSVHLRKVTARTLCERLEAWTESVGTQQEPVSYEEVPFDRDLANSLGVGQAISIAGSEERLMPTPSLYFHKNGFWSASGSVDSYNHPGGINSLLRKIRFILSERSYNKLVVGLPQT